MKENNKNGKWDLKSWTIIGLLVLCLIFMPTWFALLLTVLNNGQFHSGLKGALENWATLSAGIIGAVGAAGAAAVTIYQMRKTHNEVMSNAQKLHKSDLNQRDSEILRKTAIHKAELEKLKTQHEELLQARKDELEAERQNKLSAERAMLAWASSSLNDYLVKVAKWLKNWDTISPSTQLPPQPPLPENIIHRFYLAIPAEDPNNQVFLANIILDLQIFEARFLYLNDPGNPMHTKEYARTFFEARFTEATLLYARSDSLFAYSRRHTCNLELEFKDGFELSLQQNARIFDWPSEECLRRRLKDNKWLRDLPE